MRTGQLRGGRAPRRTKPIAPRSTDPTKVAAAQEVWQAGQDALRRDRFRCQASGLLPGRCGGKLDPQHVIPRSTRSDLRDVLANIVAVCRDHHRWIDAHPKAANVVGFHGYSWDDLEDLAARRAQARDNL